ncbi:hypothetical protein [Actinomadura terrae]|uniref:hypothetical protein n=1 Tax=Actinomadura terrae TaxID=604353 RepID=UPI001FA7D431|nr:hypothetical protein [Actinomadura terrae]
MRIPHYAPGGAIPPPRLVAAWLKTGVLDGGTAPLWAAHWIADGLDGEALRMLAGLDGSDTREVYDLLPAALDDVQAPIPDDLKAAVQVVYDDLAALYLAAKIDTGRLLTEVEVLVLGSDVDGAYLEPPLASVHALHDEWTGGWGRPRKELKALVHQACLKQTNMSAPDGHSASGRPPLTA